MKKETLIAIIKDLKKTSHRGLESNFPCDLEKIGSPGRPYRSCTCGLDDRIKEVEEELKKAQ